RPRVVLRQDAVAYPDPVEWLRDGSAILSVLERANGSYQVALVAADGGVVRDVANLGARPQHTSVSPDGAYVVYDAPQTATGRARDLYIAPTDGSGGRPLVQHLANDMAPVWSPDGRGVLFASDRSG